MAKSIEKKKSKSNGFIEGGGIVLEENIVHTLQKNYMPYAMSVIVSRALPEIDGFKPSHRKLLYTMYKMGLLTGSKIKSANVVGRTMQLNPHGDGAIYDTMVRLSRGYEALLHPYVDSKGNFGKAYSRDMVCAASRYTEVKLDVLSNELFGDIDKDTVDFIPNYDNSMVEPTLLPTTFPSILVNSNMGIAVSMASSICSFNLKEVCETTIGMLKDENYDISQTIKGPDFISGGLILNNDVELNKVIDTGRGSFRVRARYIYDKAVNCIEITQIPPTTTVEAIIDKIVDLVKLSKIREISDVRDETDLSGLKLTIDLKKGVDPDKLMLRLFKMTPLEDNFSCNFNILIKGQPKVLGIREILKEWIEFRSDCVVRRVKFELAKKQDKLHLLKGLQKILLDIDKAIKIIRETDEDSEVVANLMIGFGIDQIQAEYVGEIKLRHLNKEYILKRIQETDQLIKDIEEMQNVLGSKSKLKSIIIDELKGVIKKYSKQRASEFINPGDDEENVHIEEIQDYPVNIFLTKEGYFKKITPLSLRMGGTQKLKETDSIDVAVETSNAVELLFFTDKCQVYKSRANDFDDTKASVLGDYIPAKLGFEDGEKVVGMIVTTDYKGEIMFFYANGKVAKVSLDSYATKSNRKKLTGAYSDKSELVKLFLQKEQTEYLISSSNTRKLLFNSAMISQKSTKNTQGVCVMTQKKGQFVANVCIYTDEMLDNPHRYRTKTLPSIGALMRTEEMGEQIAFV
jgi:DNA gyrase subunit A